VFVDGIPQLPGSVKIKKPDNFQKEPKVPNFDKEAEDAVKYEGLPPLEPIRKAHGTTIFTNVKSVYRLEEHAIQRKLTAQSETRFGVVVVQNGTITCSGEQEKCFTDSLLARPDVQVINLEGGSISPGFVSCCAPLGLEEITSEPSTTDGLVPDSLLQPIPKILGGDFLLLQAEDGLQFGTRDAL
jgi:hypothetical protein